MAPCGTICILVGVGGLDANQRMPTFIVGITAIQMQYAPHHSHADERKKLLICAKNENEFLKLQKRLFFGKA